MRKFGLVYCATGHKYAALAVASICSFRAAGGDSPIQIFCDASSLKLIDASLSHSGIAVNLLEQPTFGFYDKISALAETSFDEGVFVDSDTFFLSYPSENSGKLFENDLRMAVKHFDLMARPGFSINSESESKWASRALGQFNTGVIGFRKSSAFDSFLESWRSEYEETDPHDQPAFRKAVVAGNNLRVGALMAEYNFDGHGLLNFTPRLVHFTGGPRKNFSLDSKKMVEMSENFCSKRYPRFFVDFEDVYPLPSRKLKTLGTNLNWYSKGVWFWIISRFEILFLGIRYRKSF